MQVQGGTLTLGAGSYTSGSLLVKQATLNLSGGTCTVAGDATFGQLDTTGRLNVVSGNLLSVTGNLNLCYDPVGHNDGTISASSAYMSVTGGTITNTSNGLLDVGRTVPAFSTRRAARSTSNRRWSWAIASIRTWDSASTISRRGPRGSAHGAALQVGSTFSPFGTQPTGILTVGGTGRLLASATNIDLSTGAEVTGILNIGTAGVGGGFISTQNLLFANNGENGYGSGLALVNFHGGTLQATQDTSTTSRPTYLGNSSKHNNGLMVGRNTSGWGTFYAYVYSEGATIDTNGHNVSLWVPLTAPSGNGIATIPVSNGGSGNVGPPTVQISGGGGTGSTAMATLNTAGQLTGITITNPGVGYTGTPTITLAGGGTATAATLGTPTLATNTSGGLTKQGAGTLILTGADNYAGARRLAAAPPATSEPASPRSASCTRRRRIPEQSRHDVHPQLAGTGGGAFQWMTNGGGFSAATSAFSVNVGNGAALAWGTTVGSQIVGTLKFGSTTAVGVTTFYNAVNLGGAERTVQVDDNTASAADWAVMSGNISNSSGTAGIDKTGTGKLVISGSNSYNGTTIVDAGTLTYSNAAAMASGSYTVNARTLDIGTFSKTIAGFQILGGTATGSGTLASTTSFDIRGGTVNANLAGSSIGLNKSGTARAVVHSATPTPAARPSPAAHLNWGRPPRAACSAAAAPTSNPARSSSTMPTAATRRRQSPVY